MRLQVLEKPEGGAERNVLWTTRHGCEQGKFMRAELGDDVDEVTFSVGIQGWELPSGIPFEVAAAHECRACKAWLRMWFEWHSPKLWLP